MTITLLHPGEMGAAVGACLVSRGVRVVWASEDRSPASRKRALEAGLEDLRSSTAPSKPPTPSSRSAFPAAHSTSPARSRPSNSAVFTSTPTPSPPPTPARSATWSKQPAHASSMAASSASRPLPPESRGSISCGPKAPASRHCSPAARPKPSQWKTLPSAPPPRSRSVTPHANKGETALLGIIRSLARYRRRRRGIVEGMGRLSARRRRTVGTTSPQRARKAWRWAGEMEEIAASFDAANLPSGFLANAEIYRRLAGYKDCAELPSLGRSERPDSARTGMNAQPITLVNHGAREMRRHHHRQPASQRPQSRRARKASSSAIETAPEPIPAVRRS